MTCPCLHDTWLWWFLVAFSKRWKLSMTKLTEILFSCGKFSVSSRESTERQTCHLVPWDSWCRQVSLPASEQHTPGPVLNVASSQVSSMQLEHCQGGSSIFRAKSCCQTPADEPNAASCAHRQGGTLASWHDGEEPQVCVFAGRKMGLDKVSALSSLLGVCVAVTRPPPSQG